MPCPHSMHKKHVRQMGVAQLKLDLSVLLRFFEKLRKKSTCNSHPMTSARKKHLCLVGCEKTRPKSFPTQLRGLVVFHNRFESAESVSALSISRQSRQTIIAFSYLQCFCGICSIDPVGIINVMHQTDYKCHKLAALSDWLVASVLSPFVRHE